MARSLYICYFGLREPLVQTQVLPYLREIVKDGVEMHLLTFEPELNSWTSAEIRQAEQELRTDGITWHRLKYHKHPSVPATLYDITIGFFKIALLARKYPFDIYHSRGHIPGPIAAVAKKILGGQFLFDIRGFMPEEYTDAGVWKDGSLLYRLVKRVEKWLIHSADGYVVLTEKARDILFPGSLKTGRDITNKPIEVIPCCVDFERRTDNANSAALVPKRPFATHIGALGGLYLTEEIAALMAAAREADPEIIALLLTRSKNSGIGDMLRSKGFSEDDFLIKSSKPEEIMQKISNARFGISILAESYSSYARSPTKIPEYLAAGIPVIASPNVGDVDAMLIDNKVGVILDDLSYNSYIRAVGMISDLYKDPGIRNRCRETARRLFSLNTVGGVRYRRIYKRLLGSE